MAAKIIMTTDPLDGKVPEDGTDDEWKIIQGMAEVHILSIFLPHFVKKYT